MAAVLIHFGGAKCGSSYLQRLLTRHSPLVGVDSVGANVDVSYWFSLNNNFFRTQVGMEAGFAQYAASDSEWFESGGPCIRCALKPLTDELAPNELAVISGESLGVAFSKFDRGVAVLGSDHECVGDQTMAVAGLLLVRPQVSALHSAYYQWGIFSPESLESFVQQYAPNFYWGAQCKAALGVGIQRLVVGEISEILPRFREAIGALGVRLDISQLKDDGPWNTALTVDEVRFLLRNGSLRNGVDDPRIMFLLESRRLQWDLPIMQVPWVFPRRIIRQILDHFCLDNELLTAHCDKQLQEKILTEPSWNTEAPFPKRVPRHVKRDLVLAPSVDFLEKALRGALRELNQSGSSFRSHREETMRERGLSQRERRELEAFRRSRTVRGALKVTKPLRVLNEKVRQLSRLAIRDGLEVDRRQVG